MSKIEEINYDGGEKLGDLNSREKINLRLLLDAIHRDKLDFVVDGDMVKYWMDMLSWGEDCCKYGVCKPHKMIKRNTDGDYHYVDKEYTAVARISDCQDICLPFKLVCRNKLKKFDEVKSKRIDGWSREDIDIYFTGQFSFENKREKYEKLCEMLDNNWN